MLKLSQGNNDYFSQFKGRTFLGGIMNFFFLYYFVHAKSNIIIKLLYGNPHMVYKQVGKPKKKTFCTIPTT